MVRSLDRIGAMLSLPKPNGHQTERMQMTRQHVFAINSEPAFLDVVRELLQDERFNVTTTNYLPATFDAIAVFRPALIIIDLLTGADAGWDLLQQLAADATTRAIPVMVTSTDPALLERARQMRAELDSHHLLMKPLDLEALLTTVDELIGAA